MHVGAAQVQCPCDVIEGGHEQRLCPTPLHCGPDSLKFAFSSLSGIFQRMLNHSVQGDFRTVFPDDVQRVEIGADGDSSLPAQFFGKSSHLVGGIHISVEPHYSTVDMGKRHSEPLRYGGSSFNALFHQFELRALQLFLSRYEISGVGP